jgi:hypothetical protein
MAGQADAIVADLVERVVLLEQETAGQERAAAEHEERDDERQKAVLQRFDALDTSLADIRAQQGRTLVAVVAEIGTDPVPVPFTQGREIKVRTAFALVVLAVGSVLALGWGDTVVRWVDAYLGTEAGAAELQVPEPASDLAPVPS